ncbi:tripartite tricarboxylate transporter TctB family protein [Nesterenkonia muleiensis]|uniref:tripartite tricarboxylate transporter TctB family protein n=1 Tax=Nesterenkonia muleiensis TaxID=2282648 RepID=UPI000E74FDF4|nr:tripartite tricarboxylate transporter TctB family protein [Nesterenkonia muleiensis]
MNSRLVDMRQQLRDTWAHVLVVLVLAIIFAIALWSGYALGTGTFASPGTGLWPVLASSAGVVLSLLVLIHHTLSGKEKVIPSNELFSDVSWRKVLVFSASVTAFLILYSLIGFLLSATLLIFVLLKYAFEARWALSIIMSIVAPLLLYVIFTELLSVRL